MLFNAHLCNHILLQSGGGTWDTVLYALLEVWVLGVGMSKRLCTPETSLYAERVTDLKIDGVTLTATSSLDEGAADVCF